MDENKLIVSAFDVAGDNTPINTLNSNATSGIYLHWERQGGGPTTIYQILRSYQFDGIYEPIANIAWPLDEYIDEKGEPLCYYKIREMLDMGNDNYVQSKADTQPMMGEELLVKASLVFQLRDLLQVPVHDEEGIFNRDRKIAKFAYANWAYWPRPEIRITGGTDDFSDGFTILDENDPITTTSVNSINYPDGLKYKLDYMGKAHFLNSSNNPTKVEGYDNVFASYSVRMFTTDEMNNALNMALQYINMQPGTNKYAGVGSAPYWYDPALIAGASYFLIRALLVRLNQRETRLLVQDPDSNGYNAIDNLKETVKMYKEDFDNMLKTVGKQRYPHIYSVVTPEYMMPGGRSRFFRYIWKGGA